MDEDRYIFDFLWIILSTFLYTLVYAIFYLGSWRKPILILLFLVFFTSIKLIQIRLNAAYEMDKGYVAMGLFFLCILIIIISTFVLLFIELKIVFKAIEETSSYFNGQHSTYIYFLKLSPAFVLSFYMVYLTYFFNQVF